MTLKIMEEEEEKAKKESFLRGVDPGVHEAFEILADFSRRKCWGEVTVTFRDGKVVIVNENKQTKVEC